MSIAAVAAAGTAVVTSGMSARASQTNTDAIQLDVFDLQQTTEEANLAATWDDELSGADIDPASLRVAVRDAGTNQDYYVAQGTDGDKLCVVARLGPQSNTTVVTTCTMPEAFATQGLALVVESRAAVDDPLVGYAAALSPDGYEIAGADLHSGRVGGFAVLDAAGSLANEVSAVPADAGGVTGENPAMAIPVAIPDHSGPVEGE